MKHYEEQEDCNLLTAPISLIDLIGRGATLQMNPHYDDGIADEIYDEVGLGSDGDDEDDNENKIDRTQLESPWLQPFDELKAKMLQIDENIFKLIKVAGNMETKPIPTEKALVKIRYHSYWQGEQQPFDSSSFRGGIFSFETGQGNVLEGVEKAVCSMKEGEKSHFVISYKLLFGELGCPPRIKRRADALFVIELISFKILDEQAQAKDKSLTPEERGKFSNVLLKAKELHTEGLEFFRKGMHRSAMQCFVKASEKLEFCNLANENDEREQTKLLMKLYLNLVVIYNKMKMPKKTCIVSHKIWRLSDSRPPCKALFHKGRALFMLGEYKGAKELLLRALKLEPHNIEVQKELEIVSVKERKFEETAAVIQQNALDLVEENVEEEANEPAHMLEFEQQMQQILEDFKMDTSEKLDIPGKLTKSEMKTFEELAKSLDLKLKSSENEKSYFVEK